MVKVAMHEPHALVRWVRSRTTFPVGRGQPRWIGELHDPDRLEREWLADLGVG
jgi:hypothetical protein